MSNSSGPGSDGNEKLLRISQSSSITGASQDLMSYPEHSLRESYSSAKIIGVFNSTPHQLTYTSEFGDLFLSQNPREFYASHFLGEILIFFTIFQRGQILFSWSIPGGYPFPPIHA